MKSMWLTAISKEWGVQPTLDFLYHYVGAGEGSVIGPVLFIIQLYISSEVYNFNICSSLLVKGLSK